MITAKFNFNNNLIKASYSKDLIQAKKEWFILNEEKRDEQDGLCICQRKVKNIVYMFNPKTNLTIIVGMQCKKKFQLNNSYLQNHILKNILISNLSKGEYEIIDNIIKYSKNIEDELIKFFQNKIENSNNNLKTLLSIKNEINEIIDTYSLTYLNNIYELINNKIININYNTIKNFFNEGINNNNNNNITKLIDIKNLIFSLDNNKYLTEKQIKYLHKSKDYIKVFINKKYLHVELLKYSIKIYITLEKCRYSKSYISKLCIENRFISLKDCYQYIELLDPIGKTIHKTIFIKNNIESAYDNKTITEIEIYHNHQLIKSLEKEKIDLLEKERLERFEKESLEGFEKERLKKLEKERLEKLEKERLNKLEIENFLKNKKIINKKNKIIRETKSKDNFIDERKKIIDNYNKSQESKNTHDNLKLLERLIKY